MAICLLHRWSGKGPDSVICEALFGTDILSSQHTANYVPQTPVESFILLTEIPFTLVFIGWLLKIKIYTDHSNVWHNFCTWLALEKRMPISWLSSSQARRRFA